MQRSAEDGRRPAITTPIAALLAAEVAGAATVIEGQAAGTTEAKAASSFLPPRIMTIDATSERESVMVIPVRVDGNLIEALLPIDPHRVLALANGKASSAGKEVKGVDELQDTTYSDQPAAYRVAGTETGSAWAVAVRK